MPTFTFRKSERLSNKRKIGRLFTDGQSIIVYPIRILYIIEEKSESEAPLQFAFSIPKRIFRKAVQRNALKRKLKEAFRLNKHHIYEVVSNSGLSIFGMLIYVDKTPSDFQLIEKMLKQGINKLIKKIEQVN